MPLRKLNRREAAALALLAVVLLALGFWWLRPAGSLPLMRGTNRAGPPAPAVPRIDLARLESPRSAAEAGRRNLFEFGAAPVPAATPAPPPPVATPRPPAATGVAAGGADGGGATAAAAAPLNVKYIGSVENASGVKVAVLLTDRQEVLTGQPGQVVANRYRIARIGLESVDLEDVATGQSRRVPLRGGGS